MSKSGSIRAILSVAYKELLHIWRDPRILVLILVLPPVLTLIFGHAFEATALSNAPTLLQDRDQSPESERFIDEVSKDKTFHLKIEKGPSLPDPDLLRDHVYAAVIIPQGWGKSLNSGNPTPLQMKLDGSDTSTADQLEGAVQKNLGQFQLDSRQLMIENLPEEVMDLAKQLPVEVRKQFASSMEPWTLESHILYNPKQRFIDFVIPGIIGLILQLITVTLMACTITREREAGTLSQLLITSLRRGEIVVGKVLPYLAISMCLIASTVVVAYFHFNVQFHQIGMLSLISFLFLLCSLGLGLLISAFSTTQTQAIQIAVLFLLPIFLLSGAFAPLNQLPDAIRTLSMAFPLTHFCHAFRMVNLYNADVSFIVGDLVFLILGAVVTCGGASLLLSRAEE
jgi:ABC-type multidrug transport system permease subunit